MTASPHLNRVAGDGFCLLEGVIPAVAVGAVRDGVLATAAAHKAADPRSRFDKVSGLINFDQSFAPYLAEPRLLGLCKALLGEHPTGSGEPCRTVRFPRVPADRPEQRHKKRRPSRTRRLELLIMW